MGFEFDDENSNL